MYKRFLNDNDYLSLLTKEAFNQLVRGVSDRVSEAEEVSEASIIEYLRNKFEIEKTLMVGKAIKEYDPQITYPAGACFSLEGVSYKAIKVLNGRKAPTKVVYWSEFNDPIDRMTEEEELGLQREFSGFNDDLESAFSQQTYDEQPPLKSRKYTQRNTYKPGDIVYFANKNFICEEANGPELGNIQIPGVTAWKEIETEEWESLKRYEKNAVVSCDGKFYALLKDYVEEEEGDQVEEPALTSDPEPSEPEQEGDNEEEEEEVESVYDPSQPPSEAPDDVWGLIADYDPEETYEFSDTEWIVAEDSVFVPAMDPNAPDLEIGVTHIKYDPRNANVKKHMLRMAVYELHKIIAPHNISSARITDYEASLQWLQDASRLKIDPGIPRIINTDDKKPASTYGLATFRRDYNPHENEWQI